MNLRAQKMVYFGAGPIFGTLAQLYSQNRSAQDKFAKRKPLQMGSVTADFFKSTLPGSAEYTFNTNCMNTENTKQIYLIIY